MKDVIRTKEEENGGFMISLKKDWDIKVRVQSIDTYKVEFVREFSKEDVETHIEQEIWEIHPIGEFCQVTRERKFFGDLMKTSILLVSESVMEYFKKENKQIVRHLGSVKIIEEEAEGSDNEIKDDDNSNLGDETSAFDEINDNNSSR